MSFSAQKQGAVEDLPNTVDLNARPGPLPRSFVDAVPPKRLTTLAGTGVDFHSRELTHNCEPFVTPCAPVDPVKSGAIIALKLWSQTNFCLSTIIVVVEPSLKLRLLIPSRKAPAAVLWRFATIAPDGIGRSVRGLFISGLNQSTRNCSRNLAFLRIQPEWSAIFSSKEGREAKMRVWITGNCIIGNAHFIPMERLMRLSSIKLL